MTNLNVALVLVVSVLWGWGCTSDKTTKPVQITRPGQPDVPDPSEVTKNNKKDGLGFPGGDPNNGLGNSTDNDTQDNGNGNDNSNGSDPNPGTNNSGTGTNNTGSTGNNSNNNTNDNSNDNTESAEDLALIGTWDGNSDLPPKDLVVINYELPSNNGNQNGNNNSNDNSNSNSNGNDNTNNNSNGNQNNGAGVTYAKDIAPLFNKHCTTCHSPRGTRPSSPLVNFQQVMLQNEVSISLSLNDRMPKGPVKLTAEEKALLTAWKAAGYPEGSN